MSTSEGNEAACDPDGLAEAPYACEADEVSCQIDCCDGNEDDCPGGVFPAVSQCGDNECEPQWGESGGPDGTCITDCGEEPTCD